MITLDRLRYFSEVARLEHLGQAAINLSISPSVLSSAIKTLEEELACKLFERKNNSLRLNENGWNLLERATVILEKTSSLYEEIGIKSVKIKGHYRIGASPFLMKEYLVESILKVQRENPDLTVELVGLDTGVAISQVLSGALDMALVFRSIQHQDILEEEIYHGNFQVVVKKNHKILKMSRKKMIESLNTLPAITFRTTQGPNYCETHPVFKKHGISPKHAFFYHDNNTSLKLIKESNGWAFLPDIVVKSNKKDILPLGFSLKWDAPMRVSLVKSKSNKSLLLFEALLSALKNRL